MCQLSTNIVTDAALKAFLRTVFTGQIHREYPVVSFIEKVFQFSPSNLPAKDYSLPVDACVNYLEATGERNCYTPLKRIFDYMAGQVCGTRSTRPLLADFVAMYDTPPKSNTGAKPKPDFYFSTQPERYQQHWQTCLGYGEVKRRTKEVTFEGDGVIDTSLFAVVCLRVKNDLTHCRTDDCL